MNREILTVWISDLPLLIVIQIAIVVVTVIWTGDVKRRQGYTEGRRSKMRSLQYQKPVPSEPADDRPKLELCMWKMSDL